MRAPGFELQSTRLSCIREICRILGVDSLHGKGGLLHRFDQSKLDELEHWFNHNINRIQAVFEIKLFSIKKFLTRLNRMLKAWGFARIKREREKKGNVKCPIISSPAGPKNMKKFYETVIEHSECISDSMWS